MPLPLERPKGRVSGMKRFIEKASASNATFGARNIPRRMSQQRFYGGMRRLLISIASVLVLTTSSTQAAINDFGITIGFGLLCNDVLDRGFYYNYLRKHFGEPVRQEQGAFWFSVKATLFGQQVREVFVSDASSGWTFLGAVFESDPATLAEAARKIHGSIFTKESTHPHAAWRSPSGSFIVWQGASAKMVCARLVGTWQGAQ